MIKSSEEKDIDIHNLPDGAIENVTINRPSTAYNFGLQGFDNPFPKDRIASKSYKAGRKDARRIAKEQNKTNKSGFFS